MPDLYQVLGGKIRDARTSRQLSQGDVAQRLSLSRSSITNIENGLQKISLLDLYKVAEAFEIDLVELLPARLELTQPQTPPNDKIDSDNRFSSSEKKELKKVVNQLQGG